MILRLTRAFVCFSQHCAGGFDPQRTDRFGASVVVRIRVSAGHLRDVRPRMLRTLPHEPCSFENPRAQCALDPDDGAQTRQVTDTTYPKPWSIHHHGVHDSILFRPRSANIRARGRAHLSPDFANAYLMMFVLVLGVVAAAGALVITMNLLSMSMGCGLARLAFVTIARRLLAAEQRTANASS